MKQYNLSICLIFSIILVYAGAEFPDNSKMPMFKQSSMLNSESCCVSFDLNDDKEPCSSKRRSSRNESIPIGTTNINEEPHTAKRRFTNFSIRNILNLSNDQLEIEPTPKVVDNTVTDQVTKFSIRNILNLSNDQLEVESIPKVADNTITDQFKELKEPTKSSQKDSEPAPEAQISNILRRKYDSSSEANENHLTSELQRTQNVDFKLKNNSQVSFKTITQNDFINLNSLSEITDQKAQNERIEVATSLLELSMTNSPITQNNLNLETTDHLKIERGSEVPNNDKSSVENSASENQKYLNAINSIILKAESSKFNLMFKHIIELIAKLILFRNELNSFNFYFHFHFIYKVFKNSENPTSCENPESSENPTNREITGLENNYKQILTDLVDDLLKLNSDKNGLWSVLHDKSQSYNISKRLSYTNQVISNFETQKAENLNDSEFQLETDYKLLLMRHKLKKIQEEKNNLSTKLGYFILSEKLNKLLPSLFHTDQYLFALSDLFYTINKIVNFYNNKLRANYHQLLTKIQFPYASCNQMFINYSEYESHPNYLAYLIVDQFFNLFAKDSRNKVPSRFFENIIFLNLLPKFAVLLFFILNEPQTVCSLFTNTQLFNTWKTCIDSLFTNFMNFSTVSAFLPQLSNAISEFINNNFQNKSYLRQLNLNATSTPQLTELELIIEEYGILMYKLSCESLKIAFEKYELLNR